MKPSFPEDYSGPEADNYIHLKFQEAEKKRKEKAKNQTAMHENAQKEKEPPQVIDVNKQVTLEDFLTKKSIQIKWKPANAGLVCEFWNWEWEKGLLDSPPPHAIETSCTWNSKTINE